MEYMYGRRKDDRGRRKDDSWELCQSIAGIVARTSNCIIWHPAPAWVSRMRCRGAMHAEYYMEPKLYAARAKLDAACPMCGATALHVAAGACDVAAVKKLIGRGADPDALRGLGCTPLHDALLVPTFPRLAATVKALLDGGADALRRADDAPAGFTPLRMGVVVGAALPAIKLMARSVVQRHAAAAAAAEGRQVVDQLLAAAEDAADVKGAKAVLAAVQRIDEQRAMATKPERAPEVAAVAPPPSQSPRAAAAPAAPAADEGAEPAVGPPAPRPEPACGACSAKAGAAMRQCSKCKGHFCAGACYKAHWVGAHQHRRAEA